jgi:putative DNA primase/helicase
MESESAELLPAALDYAEHGLRVIPLHWPIDGRCHCGKADCRGVGKHPIVSDWPHQASTDTATICAWWAQWPFANVGVVTGAGLLVIDLDLPDGPRTLRRLEDVHSPLPDTYTVETGSGGLHLYLRLPDGMLFSNWQRRDDLPGLDIRCDGGQVVAPPSLHHSGKRYRVLSEAPIAPAPEWVLAWLKAPPKKKRSKPGRPKDVIGEVFTEGKRHSAVVSLVGKLRWAGRSEEEILATALEFNRTRCAPPKSEEEIRKICAWVAEKPAEDPDARFIGTDVSNACKFVELFSAGVRYCFGTDRWYAFDDGMWAPDESERTLELAELVGQAYVLELGQSLDDELKAKKLLRAALELRQAHKLQRLLETARRKLVVPIEKLDADPGLLGTPGAVVSLGDGVARPGRPEDFITMSTRVAYRAKAECPAFLGFLRRITGENPAMMGFIQRAFGYSLTGDTSERCFFLCWGRGCNGKTTLLEILRAVAGDYGGEIDSSAFLYNPQGERIPNDLAAQRGKRLVTCTELPEGHGLDENVVKKLCGQDLVRVRFFRQEWFNYRPAFKLWIATNNLPRIRETNRAIWDRIRLLEFNQEIGQDEIVPNLAQNIIAAEAEGILAWGVQGAGEWRRTRLNPPAEVLGAGMQYRNREDVVGEYLIERTAAEEGGVVSKHALYADYVDWAKPDKPMSAKAFAERVREHRIDAGWQGSKKAWKGLRLGAPTDQPIVR